jgi:hypothetical protein
VKKQDMATGKGQTLTYLSADAMDLLDDIFDNDHESCEEEDCP